MRTSDRWRSLVTRVVSKGRLLGCVGIIVVGSLMGPGIAHAGAVHTAVISGERQDRSVHRGLAGSVIEGDALTKGMAIAQPTKALLASSSLNSSGLNVKRLEVLGLVLFIVGCAVAVFRRRKRSDGW